MEKLTLNTSYYFLNMCVEEEEFVKKGAKQPMDGKMGERLDFENMTEEEKEEMLEKRGNEGVNGENRKRPTNDVESEPNTQDTSTTSDTNNSTQNS